MLADIRGNGGDFSVPDKSHSVPNHTTIRERENEIPFIYLFFIPFIISYFHIRASQVVQDVKEFGLPR